MLRTSWSLVERAIMQFIKSTDKFYAGQSLTDILIIEQTQRRQLSDHGQCPGLVPKKDTFL